MSMGHHHPTERPLTKNFKFGDLQHTSPHKPYNNYTFILARYRVFSKIQLKHQQSRKVHKKQYAIIHLTKNK